MNAMTCADILAGRAPAESPVTLRGWVRTRRDSKAGISFVHVSDGSCFHPVQVVAPNTLANYGADVMHLTAGCAVEATGTIVPSPAKGQPFEMQAGAIRVVGWVEDPDTYPIQPKPHTLEFLRDVAHLRPRTNVIGALTRVRHTIAHSIHRFFHTNGFYWVNTPIITSSDAEGAGEMFRVSTLDHMNLPRDAAGKIDYTQDFFGRETFLTVSGQLNVEAYCLALSKVYTFGPTFRAENSNTSRHLAEFWMIEPEIAFADLADNATLAEALLKHIFRTVLDERADDMAFFEERIEKGVIAKLTGIVDSEFVRMDYTEAIRVLENAKQKFEFPVKWGIDLQSEHERYVSEKHAGKPVVLMNYPKEIKAFYMRLERRRPHGRRDGRARARHRRNHRRQPARGAARRARCPHTASRHGQRSLRLVSGPAPVRHGAARGFRTRLRANRRLRDRARERAGRHPVPADARQRPLLRDARVGPRRRDRRALRGCRLNPQSPW